MSVEYIHQEVGQEVRAIAGSYVLTKEVRQPFQGQEVLYVVGYGSFDACCGVGGCSYALVPGFIRSWKDRYNDDLAVSAVDPVTNREQQENLTRLIKSQEDVTQVNFLKLLETNSIAVS